MIKMAHQPLVTIVTPLYNQQEFIAETIESVLGQEYGNIEYIVIDDGSTDAGLEIAQRYSGRVRVVSQANIGQAGTLNRGWADARGEILGYLSSDDVLKPQAVSRLVEALSNDPASALAYPDYELIDRNSNIFRYVPSEPFDAIRLTVDLVCLPGPGVLFRKSLYEQVGGWRADLLQIPDFEFWMRLSRLGHFVNVAEALALYRVHEQSASFRPVSRARSAEIVEVVDQFWPNGSLQRPRAMANAHLISARSHAQSRRYGCAAHSAATAFVLYPRIALSRHYWKSLASGSLRPLVPVGWLG